MSNVSIDDSTTVTTTTQPQPRGRPCKTDAKSSAQRAKDYRDRLKTDGFKEVKCYLNPEHMAYLGALSEIHGGTIADSIALALTLAMKGELSAPAPVHESPPTSLIILQ